MAYVVQLENGAFLTALNEWGDDIYIYYTLEAAEDAVAGYEEYFDINSGDAVVKLFQIIQARWDNGQPLGFER